MAWQPEQEPLRQLSGCLRDSLSGHNKTAQKQAEIMLAQAKSSPDINNYLKLVNTLDDACIVIRKEKAEEMKKSE